MHWIRDLEALSGRLESYAVEFEIGPECRKPGPLECCGAAPGSTLLPTWIPAGVYSVGSRFPGNDNGAGITAIGRRMERLEKPQGHRAVASDEWQVASNLTPAERPQSVT